MVNKWLIINTLRNEQIFTRTMQNIVIDTVGNRKRIRIVICGVACDVVLCEDLVIIIHIPFVGNDIF